MPWIQFSQTIRVLALSICAISASYGAAAEPVQKKKIDFVAGDGRVAVLLDGMPVAVYCYDDITTLRPYFAHVRTPSGIQVTRNHPPIAGHDLADHDSLHPGIWLAFGDINSLDFWRNKGRIKHNAFIEPPTVKAGRGSFKVQNDYLDPKDPSRIVCSDLTRYTFVPFGSSYFILWDISFTSDQPFTFGDQEEMGLGIRMATPVRVGDTGTEKVPPGNGTITNSAGAVNEKSMWGDSADWCDFSGTIADQRVGATILCHPENFRKSRFHARDYGMLTANAFAQGSFGKGDKLETTVQPGKPLRLRYGLYIHGDLKSKAIDPAVAYEQYLRLAQ